MQSRRSLFFSPRLFLCLLLPLAAVGPGLADEETPAGLDRRISLDLEGAAAVDVFNSFAAISDAEPELDPRLGGKVTIKLNNVSTRTTMNAVCEMLDCHWGLEEGPPRKLKVKVKVKTDPEEMTVGDAAGKEARGNLETPIDMSLRDAPVEEVLRSFAKIGRWKFQLEATTVSIELEDTPVREALDEVCAQAGCVWSLEELGDEAVLRVKMIE